MPYCNMLDSNTIQTYAHSFKASACCYTGFFSRHNSQSMERHTPLFHLVKSQSASCTRCSDLDHLSAQQRTLSSQYNPLLN